MKRFDSTELWEAFKTSDSASAGLSVEPNGLFNDFVIEVQTYCREEKDIAERTRTLNYARGELEVYAEEYASGAKRIRAILKRAIRFIESETDLIRMELAHPERFISFLGDPAPLARWNGKTHELIEYVTPLQLTGKLLKPSGEPMSYIELVRIIESICDITVPRPHDVKTRLLSRKKNVTPFIDEMRHALVNASENSYL